MIETTWMRIGDFTVESPVTAATNVLLTVQCLVSWIALRGLRTPGARRWSGFFLAMAVATSAGVVKHGAGYLLSGPAWMAVLWTSNVASGLSTWAAQRATIALHAGPGGGGRARLEGLAALQFAIYLGINVRFGPAMTALIANTAVGLTPVLLAEAAAGRHGDAGAKRVAAGLLLSMGAGLAYQAHVSPGLWFNHMDLTHVLMGASLYLVYVGARRRRHATSTS